MTNYFDKQGNYINCENLSLAEIYHRAFALGVESVAIDERPHGDLISRSALLKAMEEERQYLLARGQTGAEHILVHHCLPIIDNAPTVPSKVEFVTKNGITFPKALEMMTFSHELTTEERQNIEKAYMLGVYTNARPHGEWIPVSKRLPEEKTNPKTNDFEEVLCTTIWEDVRAYKFGKPIGHDKPHFWLGGEIMDEYVIAWQLLPESYKEN